MPQAGFKPTIPANQAASTYTLDRAATGTSFTIYAQNDHVRVTLMPTKKELQDFYLNVSVINSSAFFLLGNTVQWLTIF
jgi:hypothetical protein